MEGAFKRSWELTKLTIEVIKKDKELIFFPILAGVFSFIFIIAMIFPVIIAPLLLGSMSGFSILANWLMIFLIYLGLAFIAIFFNVCVVYTAKKRFEGGNATFSESIKFAFSKFHLILSWSLVSAIVGLILRIIDNIAERMGGIGELMIKIINSVLGGVWALLTIFVVPGMVYHGYSPIQAVKNSAITFKKTWGENLIRVFGFGLAQLVFFIAGIGIGVLLIFTSLISGSAIIFLASIMVIVIYFVGVVVFFQLANTVFSTALYVYAEKGKVPAGFTKEIMEKSFGTKKSKI
jgi:hypothetical protein